MADEPRLKYVLAQLEEGHMSTAEAARLVRGMTFSAAPRKTAYQTVEADGVEDPEVPPDGSFFPVSLAYITGRINRAQYEALAQAAGR